MSYSLLVVTLLSNCRPSPKADTVSGVYIDTGEPYKVYYHNRKAGMLDWKGKVVLPSQFDYIDDYSYDHLVLVDSGGHKIEGFDVTGYEFKKYGIVTDRGKILFRPMFDKVAITDHMIMLKMDSLYGYATDKGNWVVQPKFRDARPFYGGTAIVKIGDKYTLINKAGKAILRKSYTEIWNFKNGVSVVHDGRKYGFINYKGQIILPVRYNGIGEYNWNYGKVFKNNRTYLVDTLGKIYKTPFDTVETYEGKNHTTIAKGRVKGKAVEIQLN